MWQRGWRRRRGRRVSGRDEEGLSYLPRARGAALATSFVHTLCTHDGGRERVWRAWRAGTDSIANTGRDFLYFFFAFFFSMNFRAQSGGQR